MTILNRPVFLKLIITAVLAGAAVVFAGAAEPGEENQRVHRVGRVILNMPGNGALSSARDGRLWYGLRWPGEAGMEFLGSCGIMARIETNDGEEPVSVGPARFAALDIGGDVHGLREGCEGGKRSPDRGRDDDGDGLIDEDPIDGIDNDGDGLIDEDFAAVGDRMIVTRAVEPATGLVLGQRSYTWSYGHVRDFVGFTTELEYPEGGSRDSRAARLAAALLIDFKIGDPGDGSRGEDDRTFLVKVPVRGEAGLEEMVFAAVSGGSAEGYYAGALILGATGRKEGNIEIGARILDPHEADTGRWCLIEDGEGRGNGEVEGRGGEAVPVFPRKRLEFHGSGRGEVPLSAPECTVSESVEGDMVIVFEPERGIRFEPGERIEIEWALVFGSSIDMLVRNARRAFETHLGIQTAEGGRCRWIVPARKAVRRELDAKPASVWVHGKRQQAVSIILPDGFEIEEVEWIRAGGSPVPLYEKFQARILVPVGRDMIQGRGPLVIEGQLTDGTVFSAAVEHGLLDGSGDESRLQPGKLPDEAMRLFPNPFVTSLNVKLYIPGRADFTHRQCVEGLSGTSSVKIYDVQGRLVRALLEEEVLHPGDYSLGWDGFDDLGQEVAPGVYYCKLQIGSRSLTKRVILLR